VVKKESPEDYRRSLFPAKPSAFAAVAAENAS